MLNVLIEEFEIDQLVTTIMKEAITITIILLYYDDEKLNAAV